MNWSVFLAAISSVSIEFLETAVIAYAIAQSGYPREAIWGTAAGLTAVAGIACVFGAGLQQIPLHWLQIGVGIVLLVFGWGWVKKSVQRQAQGRRASWIAEEPLVAEGITLDTQPQGFSKLNFLIMTKSAALEALEVAVVVVTLGLASDAWVEALGATVLALLLAIVLVAALHRYLLNLPEVLIKLGAGILLCALGSFWLGEGLRLKWWFGDGTIVAIVALYSLLAALAIYTLKLRQAATEAAKDGM